MADTHQPWPQDAALFASALLDAWLPAPSFLTSSTGSNDPRRFAVYRNNVTVSLIIALRSNFPSIERLVGDEFFAAMAQEFVRTHPPRSRLMFEYGSEFPAFLESFEPVGPYPYLPDVARLEIHWRQAFHEADAPVLNGANLSSVAQEDFPHLTFIRHPATRMLASRYAAGSIFAANRKAGETAAFDPSVAQTVLVTRPFYDCEVRVLEPGADGFISSLLDGDSMRAAVEAAFAISSNFDLPAAIGTLIASGAFSAIKEY